MDWGKQVMNGISDITGEDSGTLSPRIKDAVHWFFPPLLMEHLAPLPLRLDILRHDPDTDLVMLRQSNSMGSRKKIKGRSI